MKSYSSRDIIEILELNGWVYKYSRGSHNYYIHHERKGKVTIPHPRKDITKGTLKSITRLTGITFE